MPDSAAFHKVGFPGGKTDDAVTRTAIGQRVGLFSRQRPARIGVAFANRRTAVTGRAIAGKRIPDRFSRKRAAGPKPEP
jgi:hypothetical protein